MRYLLLLVALFLALTQGINLHASDYYFEHITVADGLSQNYITCIYQDSRGFMWFGTPNGLNRYDGYQVKEYNADTDNKRSLPDNNISVIFEDSDQRLWIGTHDGLCRYCPQTDDFAVVNLDVLSENTPENRHILSFYEDADHVLWIGSIGGALYAYDTEDDELEFYVQAIERAPVQVITSDADLLLLGCANNQGTMHLDKENRRCFRTKTDSLYPGLSITSLLRGGDGGLWVGSNNKGVHRYGKSAPEILLHDVQGLCTLSDSLMIIITENSGLYEYNMHRQSVDAIDANQKQSNLNSDAVTCVYADSSDILWVGTTNGGVNKFDSNSSHFKHISLHTGDLNRQNVNSVLAICELDERNLLVGLDNKGLMVYDKVTGQLLPHDIGRNFPDLKDVPVNAVLRDSRGFTWVGTYRKSIKVVGPQPEQNQINKLISQEIPANSSVKYVMEDSRHRVWIATSLGEVFCYDPGKKSMDKYKKGLNDLINPNVMLSLYEDSDHHIWAGSLCGLYRFDEKNEAFEQMYLPNRDNLFANRNIIVPICQVDDVLWVGSQDGLIGYSLKTKRVSHYGMADGLPGNKIKGILFEEKSGSLWISTDKGLSRLDLKNKRFFNFGLEDGILNREFNYMSFMRGQNGDFFLGSVNGIYHFNPEKMVSNPHEPKIAITSYQLYDNESVAGADKGMRYIPVVAGDKISIPYSESTFSIHYVGLNYTQTCKNEYAYRLLNYDDKWRYVGNRRIATFTNLDPGVYRFQVTASNGSGIWNKDGSELTIEILPPWYRTIWAYIIYAVVAVSLIIFLMRAYTNRVKMKSQLENEQFERRQSEKLNQMKMAFFSNITHEFRTPLTLILSPLASIINKRVGKSAQDEYLKIIQNNALKLLELVNELLDFSKSEAGNFSFNPVHTDLNKVIEREMRTFMPLAESKSINMACHCEEESLTGMADPVILRKIVSNLLSNAIKHTPEGGMICVHVEKSEAEGKGSVVRICVEDTGKGIPQDQQSLIFERFYQMKEDSSNGTGIGLALVKNLVELHHGSISIESTVGVGSKFIIEIPYVQSSLPLDEVDQSIVPTVVSVESEAEEHVSGAIGEEKKTHTVLIAEDNRELRTYMCGLLAPNYNVLVAENGREAWEMTQKDLPDVIISDVLMPEMDGKEFCRCVKRDVHTCHIFFIMLTALASEDCQKEGLKVGADDYLTKPFNPEILLSKLANIFQRRTHISRQTQTMQALKPEEVVNEDKDSRFLLDLIEIIKANLSNSDLKIDDIGKELGMSRTPFYKKIKELTNHTPNDFLKTLRLEQAKKYLSDSDKNISEIAYMTGFSSPKYFRECFKKQYGESPTEFVQRMKACQGA